MRRTTVDLAWGPVSYLEWGRTGSGAPIVLLHGGGYDSAWLSWSELGPALAAAGHHVIAPDHPGFGESPPAAWDATVANLSIYVDEFIDALGVAERYCLAGLSLGGALSLARALDRPDGLEALVLFGPYGIMPRMGLGRFSRVVQWLTWAAVHSGLLDVVTPWYAKNRRLMEASMRNLLRSPTAKTAELMDEVMVEAARPHAGRAFSQWQRSEITSRGLRTDFTSRLGELRVPTLIVQGGKDVGVPLVRAQAAAELIPDARLVVVDGAAHWVQRDRPDIVNPAVVEFLTAASH